MKVFSEYLLLTKFFILGLQLRELITILLKSFK